MYSIEIQWPHWPNTDVLSYTQTCRHTLNINTLITHTWCIRPVTVTQFPTPLRKLEVVACVVKYKSERRERETHRKREFMVHDIIWSEVCGADNVRARVRFQTITDFLIISFFLLKTNQCDDQCTTPVYTCCAVWVKLSHNTQQWSVFEWICMWGQSWM